VNLAQGFRSGFAGTAFNFKQKKHRDAIALSSRKSGDQIVRDIAKVINREEKYGNFIRTNHN
jgi:hypothetical protein